MQKVKDLTQGPILGNLIRLSLPIIGTSFMQMAYNLTDMMWLGQLGSGAVAAVGAASFFSWFGISILLITRIGAEVGVSQSIGRRDLNGAARYARHAIVWAIILIGIYATITLWQAPHLLNLLNLQGAMVHTEATLYLRIISIGFLATYLNPTFQGIYNGAGNSRQPFWYLLAGLFTNIVLDPLLIFGLGPIKGMGVAGAGYATVVAQLLVATLFLRGLFFKKEIFDISLRQFRLNKAITASIFKLGLPVAAEGAMFSIFAMVLARLITQWGDVPLAVQSVGSQIEAISWMTASGLATALGAFTGQNFGNGNWHRIRKGYAVAIGVGITLGLIVTAAFIIFGKQIFSVFLDEPEPLAMGITYLKILAISQTFMIVEILTRGAFNGIGRTIPPSITGIAFTGMRIPLAMALMAPHLLGMYAIWWAITLSSVVKGVVLSAWFGVVLHRRIPFTAGGAKQMLMSIIPCRVLQAGTVAILNIKGNRKK